MRFWDNVTNELDVASLSNQSARWWRQVEYKEAAFKNSASLFFSQVNGVAYQRMTFVSRLPRPMPFGQAAFLTFPASFTQPMAHKTTPNTPLLDVLDVDWKVYKTMPTFVVYFLVCY